VLTLYTTPVIYLYMGRLGKRLGLGDKKDPHAKGKGDEGKRLLESGIVPEDHRLPPHLNPAGET
jgi:hypothetical protein